MDDDSRRLSRLRQRIDQACVLAGRETHSVRLLAVSKSQPVAAVERLFAAGHRAFGENRLQEALAKQAALAKLDIEWHFIGAVQSNKTRELAVHFDWVQSVDRPLILERLADQRPPGRPPLNVCLQVNIDAEPQKAGLAPGQVAEVATLAQGLPGIVLRGLMCIPRFTDQPLETRDSLSRMRMLYQQLQSSGMELDTLSMGMSADFELAIAEGSTMVRVGTELFGPRSDQEA